MSKIELGTLSFGTMRTRDLIPLFVNEVLRIDPSNKVANEIWAGYCEFEEDDDADSYWESEGASWDLDALFDELNNLCDIPGVYFGAHPNDGADYGFWLDPNYEE